MTTPPKMPLKYFLGWWAALLCLWGPSGSRYGYTTTSGVVIAVLLLTALSYGLARLGWRLGWFRKTT
jgi:hypothetical protein